MLSVTLLGRAGIDGTAGRKLTTILMIRWSFQVYVRQIRIYFSIFDFRTVACCWDTTIHLETSSLTWGTGNIAGPSRLFNDKKWFWSPTCTYSISLIGTCLDLLHCCCSSSLFIFLLIDIYVSINPISMPDSCTNNSDCHIESCISFFCPRREKGTGTEPKCTVTGQFWVCALHRNCEGELVRRMIKTTSKQPSAPSQPERPVPVLGGADANLAHRSARHPVEALGLSPTPWNEERERGRGRERRLRKTMR